MTSARSQSAGSPPARSDQRFAHQALHVGVLVERRLAPPGVDRDEELLARAEGKRLGDHVVHAHDAGLGGEDVVVGRLDLPQRAQAHRVGAEHALVAMTGDQRHGALRERAHRLAQVHVERVELGRERAHLVDDRRHHHLHRLGQREAVAADQRVDHPVEVLGVGGARLDRHAEHLRLLAQLRDRVDLAVVAEHRERLDALERGPGIGRVAVVAEAADRLEALVAQVRVVLAEHLRRPHHLVDAGGRAEGRHVDVQLALELDHQLEDALGAGRIGDEPADLPEVRAPPRAPSRRGPASPPVRRARRGCGSRLRRGPAERRAGACRDPKSAR